MKLKAFAVVLILLVSAFFYTNCTVPYTEEVKDLATLAENSEWAYDASIDQIAYMSCDMAQIYDPITYFTFRAGAYRTEGLKIRDGFTDTIDSTLNTPEEQMSYIMESARNSNTAVQIALQADTDYQAVFTRSGSATERQDFSYIFPELGDRAITESLYNNMPNRIRYLRTGLAKGDLFEADLQISASYGIADALREGLVGRNAALAGKTLFLGLTFAGSMEGNFTARSPYDFMTEEERQTSSQTPRNAVYGKGYFFDIGRPAGATASNFPNYVITSVTERDLMNVGGTTIGQWTCPTIMQLQIVRPDDNWNSTNDTLRCPTHADSQTAAQYQDELRIIRNSLRAEDWYVHIDGTKNCAVPKRISGTTCYGAPTTPTRLIQYDLTAACTPDGGNAGNPACSHFVSICTRN